MDVYNYHNDHRVIARDRTKRMRFDEARMTLTFDLENDDGDEEEHALPARFDVCPTCRGKGSHVNPSIDCDGITGSEWADEWDDEERDSYRRGVYDVPCYECGGRRVVAEIDEASLNEEERSVVKRLHDVEREDAAYDAMSRAERAMGA